MLSMVTFLGGAVNDVQAEEDQEGDLSGRRGSVEDGETPVI